MGLDCIGRKNQSVLITMFCLIHLKNTSISHRCTASPSQGIRRGRQRGRIVDWLFESPIIEKVSIKDMGTFFIVCERHRGGGEKRARDYGENAEGKEEYYCFDGLQDTRADKRGRGRKMVRREKKSVNLQS